LIDFGTVKETVTTVYDEGGAPTTSLIIGSPGYMPMEQAVGLAVYASDLYSLGWTAIYLLTAKQPAELVDRRTEENHWRRFAPDVDYNLAVVIDKAVQRVSRDRYATAGEMMEALHPSLPDTVPSPLPKPTSPQPLPPTPVPPEPVPQPIPPTPVPPVPPVVESEYLLEPADRWRIPLLYFLICLPLFAAGILLLPNLLPLIIWSACVVAQALLLRKYFNPILWIVVTTTGTFIVSVITWLVGGAGFGGYNPYFIWYFLRLETFIIIMGIGQWLVLIKYVKIPQKWLVASLVTAIAIFIAYVAEVNDGKLRYTAPLINWPLATLMLGAGQALCLRYFHKKKAVEKKI
jgi:hypothetical protein